MNLIKRIVTIKEKPKEGFESRSYTLTLCSKDMWHTKKDSNFTDEEWKYTPELEARRDSNEGANQLGEDEEIRGN